MDYTEKTLHSEQVFSGKVLKLRVDEVLLSDGKMSSREIVEHNGGVGILAVRDKKIILVRQFRKPIESSLYEIPAGKLEKGEDPLSCAIREMEEETGLVPENIELLLTIYPSPGFSSEKLYIYMSDSFKSGSVHRDEDEFMDVEYVDISKTIDMIHNGEIMDAKTICALLTYVQGINKNQ